MAKDAWEKADILSKFVSGIGIAVLALVLKYGSDKIASSQRQSEIASRLIGDLAASDTSSRRVLSIIALDNAIPVPDREEDDIVADLCIRILTKTRGETNSDEVYEILRARAPNRANKLQSDMMARMNEEVSHSRPSTAIPDTAPRQPGGK